MPIYEYRRPDGSTFEVRQSFSEEPLTHDPDTGVEVTRVLHAPAVHFKGSGFYNTDYGTRKRQRENAASESSDSGSSADAASSAESKTGASSESKAGSSSESKSESKPAPSSAKESSKKVASPAKA